MDIVADLQRRVEKLEALGGHKPQWVYANDPAWVGTANAPLTSTSWDGDSFSTTAKTLIDLSADFGVPAGVKAVDVYVRTRDSGSAGAACVFVLSPNDTSGSGKAAGPAGRANDAYDRASFTVPCDANGDIYFQITATGAGTFDVWLEVWGYELP